MSDRQNGKGAIVRWICRRHRPFRVASEDSPIVPVVVTELPLQPRPDELMGVLASALGLLRCKDWTDLQQRYQSAFVRLIILRNAHELVDWSKVEQHSILTSLLAFAEGAGIGLVFCGLPQFQSVLMNYKDILGGIPRVTLPLWNIERLGDFLPKLELALGLPQASLSRHANTIFEQGTGCIGDTIRCIQRSLAATGAGKGFERFSVELVRG
jgi:hypothetical protein